MNLADTIYQIVKNKMELKDPFYGKVKSVDTEAKTCVVTRILDDLDILDVRLSADPSNGVLLLPKVDSVVGVVLTNQDEGFIALYSQIDSIQYGDGSFSGILKVGETVSKLNAIEQDLNNLKSVLSSWTPVPQDGGAALKAAISSYAGSSLTETQQADLENEKITHGNF